MNRRPPPRRGGGTQARSSPGARRENDDRPRAHPARPGFPAEDLDPVDHRHHPAGGRRGPAAARLDRPCGGRPQALVLTPGGARAGRARTVRAPPLRAEENTRVPAAGPRPAPRRFAALRNRDCRPYLIGGALAMMADNIEHVVTYWVLWQRFHSPALAGFEVISHWVPFLLFSVYFGSLADRYDCRRLIQAAQALFMLVSALWGVLFLTRSLRVWEACLLLVLHGCAGALWGPGEQLMLHDFVGREELPSAVRLNATFRSLGVLFGPVVGSALLLGLGPVRGIFVNIAIYLPLTLFLFRTKFTGHLRDHGPRPPRVGMLGSLRVLKDVKSDHTLVSMIVLGGLGSFFIGTSLQTAMPLFAQDLGAGSAGLAYGVLMFANGAGGVIGGILLE